MNNNTPPKEILNKMVDEMPFKIPPHVFPYIEEAMKLYAEESVKEMLSEKDKERLKIYRVEFEGVYPVGNCLVLSAYNQQQAEEMASKTIAHTDKFVVNELTLNEPQIIEYLSGDY